MDQGLLTAAVVEEATGCDSLALAAGATTAGTGSTKEAVNEVGLPCMGSPFCSSQYRTSVLFVFEYLFVFRYLFVYCPVSMSCPEVQRIPMFFCVINIKIS